MLILLLLKKEEFLNPRQKEKELHVWDSVSHFLSFASPSREERELSGLFSLSSEALTLLIRDWLIFFFPYIEKQFNRNTFEEWEALDERTWSIKGPKSKEEAWRATPLLRRATETQGQL